MNTLLILAIIITVCILLPAILGLFIEKDHTVSRSAWFNNSPDQLWPLISDYASQKTWRTDLRKIELLKAFQGAESWKEVSKNGSSLQLAATEIVPDSKLVRTIINNRAFGGNWVIELQPESHGTTVRITENGFINNPGLRFIFRFFINPTSSIDKYLNMLGNYLGQKVELK